MTWKEEIKKRTMRRKPQTKVAGVGRVPRAKDTGTAKRGREPIFCEVVGSGYN